MRGPAAQTQQHVVTGYDQHDNPTYKLVTQASWGGVPRDNVHSFSFGYDRLDRLTKSDMGQLNSAKTDIETTGSVPMPQLAAWNLGIVDSWNGTTGTNPLPGLLRQGDLSGTGAWSSLATTHATDQTNQIGTVTTVANGGTPVATQVRYDAAGNLILDGMYFYQYDGLNRLVQVSVQGSVTYTPASGSTPASYGGTPGNWLIQYAYDGLGRLARAQRPWPQPGTSLVRIEHYYYDGVRRIQEVFIDPLEDANINTKGVSSKDEQDTPVPVITNLIWTAREYIWGPDYVDELVAQIAPGGAGMGAGEIINYALTGHAGTVTALLDVNGNVQAQYSYDPYGELLAADVNPAMPRNRVGHQGLFFDRLNGNVLDQQLGKGFVGTYYNRNRTYCPGMGRFLQRDPNGISLAMQIPNQFLGSAPVVGTFFPDMPSHFGDGVNSMAYVRCAPTSSRDPMGLFGIIGGLSTGMSMADLASDMMDAAFTGVFTGLGLIGMVDEYDAYVDSAMDWAGDWRHADDAYARSATWASHTGYWADTPEPPEESQEEAADLEMVTAALEVAALHDHHGFPAEFRRPFKSRLGIGVDAKKYRAMLKDTYHLNVVHGKNRCRKGGAYNQFWEEFLKGKHGPVSKANALKKLKAIKKNGWRIPTKWRR